MDKPTNGAKAPGQTAEMGLKAIRVFADLCELLEEYAPSWYSEEFMTARNAHCICWRTLTG